MSSDRLSNEPKDAKLVSGGPSKTWFYEEPNGLLVCHEIRSDEGRWVRTDQVLIPWRSIKAYARHQGMTDEQR